MMDEKMKAAFDAWLAGQYFMRGGPVPEILVVEWTLEYLRSQQEPDIDPDEAFDMGLERIAYYTHPIPSAPAAPDGGVLIPAHRIDKLENDHDSQ